jgi:hypothetical protein
VTGLPFSRALAPQPLGLRAAGAAGAAGAAVAPPDTQQAGGWCRTDRVTLGGGALNTLLLDPAVVPFERLWRILPEEGMYHPGVSPDRPCVLEIGAFKVQDTMAVVIFDLRPDIYRLSGVDAGDYVPVEARRFNGVLGFDLTVNGRRSYTDMTFQLDPVASPLRGTLAFQADPGSSDFFAAPSLSAAASFASSAGAGNALQPNRPRRPGSPSVPYCIYARSGQVVQARLVVFRPVPSPLACIEYSVQGITIPAQTLETTLQCVKSVADIPR